MAAAQNGDDVQPDMSVKDWYYKTEEYSALSQAKKKALQLMQKKRTGQKKGNDPKAKFTLPKRKVKAIQCVAVKAAVKALSKAKIDNDVSMDIDSSDDDEEMPMPQHDGPSNRSNKALQRKNT